MEGSADRAGRRLAEAAWGVDASVRTGRKSVCGSHPNPGTEIFHRGCIVGGLVVLESPGALVHVDEPEIIDAGIFCSDLVDAAVGRHHHG